MLVWFVALAHAEKPTTYDPSPLIKQNFCVSEKLFIGTIVNVKSYWANYAGTPKTIIHSDVTFKVERDIKNSVASTVVLTLEGGQIGNQTMFSSRDWVQPRLGLRYLMATAPMGVDTEIFKKGQDVVVGWEWMSLDAPLPALEDLQMTLGVTCGK